jgi:hypothetical protein
MRTFRVNRRKGEREKRGKGRFRGGLIAASLLARS